MKREGQFIFLGNLGDFFVFFVVFFLEGLGWFNNQVSFGSGAAKVSDKNL